jgi:hypothetical protein
MAFSGIAHQARAGHQAEARGSRSPDLQIRLVEIARVLADSENTDIL